MPHPRRVDVLAEAIAAVGDQIDRAVVAHIVRGSRLPTETQILARIRPRLVEAVTVAFHDIAQGEPVPAGAVELEVNRIEGELRSVVRGVFRDAERRRDEVERLARVGTADDDDVPSGAALVAAGAAFGAVLGVVARRSRRGLGRGGLQRSVVARVAAQVGQPLPPRVGPRFRQIVRTRIAERRNDLASELADRLTDGVVLVEDGRLGPTDEACEEVDGQYATTVWARRHRVEHPNCTRRFRPAPLPPGRRVTLLS